MADNAVADWTSAQCIDWARRKHLNSIVAECIQHEDLDGRCLLALSECDIRDLRDKYGYNMKISDIKRFWMAVRSVQRENVASMVDLGLDAMSFSNCSTNRISTSSSSGSGGSTADGAAAAAATGRISCSSCSGVGVGGVVGGSGAPIFHHSISCDGSTTQPSHQQHIYGPNNSNNHHHHHHHVTMHGHDLERVSPPLSVDGCATSIQPEFFKTFISLGE